MTRSSAKLLPRRLPDSAEGCRQRAFLAQSEENRDEWISTSIIIGNNADMAS